MQRIQLNLIKTLFLDVGNTMLSIDFPWVCDKLHRLGINCQPEHLLRAEAAVRPLISQKVQKIEKKEKVEVFILYLETVLRKVLEEIDVDTDSASLARQLAPELLPDGKTDRLWSYVLPGVREALDIFKRLDLQLVVVSNSDGSIDRSLKNLDLRHFFDAVIDSHVVGVEKPHPRIFELALQVANAGKESTLHVGDMVEIDIEGALAAGIQGVLVDPFGDWKGVDCPKVISILELSRLFLETDSMMRKTE